MGDCWQGTGPQAVLGSNHSENILIVICSNLPDIVDKPLFLLKLAPGTRAYGHTVLFLILGTTCSGFIRLDALGVSGCDQLSLMRVVGVSIASHLLADMAFGFVPLFWPLPGWSFRSQSLEKERDRCRAKRWKRVLDFGSVLFVSFGTNVPEHLGGWEMYCAMLLGFMGLTEIAVRMVKAAVRRRTLRRDGCIGHSANMVEHKCASNG